MAARNVATGESRACTFPQKINGRSRRRACGKRAARNENPRNNPRIGFCSCTDTEVDRAGALDRGVLPGAGWRSFPCNAAAGNRVEIATAIPFDTCRACSCGLLALRRTVAWAYG